MENLFQTVEHLSPLLSGHLEQEELDGRLSKDTIETLKKSGLYKLFLPSSLGGLEADPVTTAKLIEHISRYNAAAAWSVMVAGASAWWSKYLPAETVEEIFTQSSENFFAGTFAAPTKATQVDGGYIVNGQVPLCSNVHEANWIAVSAIVIQDGKPATLNGAPEFRIVVLKATDCKIVNTWQALGMKSTDSNDVMVSDVFVPDYHTGLISPGAAYNGHYHEALYRFPVAGINGCSLIAPVALGVAANIIEELKLLTEKIPSGSAVSLKEKQSFQKKFAMAQALVRSARNYLYQSLQDCWNKVQNGEPASLEDKAALLLAAAHTNKSCVEAADLVFSSAGTTGVYKRNKISRYFTDMQVVRQHGFINENRFETAAQLMLGVSPDFFPAIL
jgi:alkylation response protein AidB-like acyl-CoA dehydrogenase